MAIIKYKAHCANFGWQNDVEDGQIAGTIGQNRAIEAFRVTELNVDPGDQVNIAAHAHVQDLGWSNPEPVGGDVGSTGLNKHIEAVKIGLTGKDKDKYEIFYRLHVQNKGFLNWSKNGEVNGTIGGNVQAEAIQIEVHKKEEHWYPYTDNINTFMDLTPKPQPKPEAKPQIDKRAELIKQAQSYIGYVSGTHNDSVFGRRYAGANAGAWCCFFVRNCCDNAGVTFPKTGYVPDVEQWAKVNGRWTGSPIPGDAVLFDFNGNGTPDHIGIVESVKTSSHVIAIEGNTGSPVGVYRKDRASGIRGYVRLG